MVFLQSLYDHVLSTSSCSLFLMIMMMMNLVFAAAGPTGLTTKLIHRDSPGSPLYPGNLTKLELMERAIQRSIHREQRLISTWQHQMKQVSSNMNNSTTTTTTSKSDTDMVRPKMKYYEGYTYMVELGLGTFSHVGSRLKFPIYYYFYFDTGSDLLWLQCDSSFTGHTNGTQYFHQDPDCFRGQYSVTYHPLSYFSEDPICKKFVGLGVPAEGNFCPYRVSYADGGRSEGVLATEKLTVNANADSGGVEEIKNFVFGCGFRQVEPNFGQDQDGPNPVVGIVGLGGGKASLIRQLRLRAQSKFEYCLKPVSVNDHPDTHTFLRFGSDTKIVAHGPGVQTTATFVARGETLYYVNMVGISVDGQPIIYPEGSNVFGTRADGTGGCIFDSGTDITTLSAEIYAPFREYLVAFFSSQGIQTTAPRGQLEKLNLCFPSPVEFHVFPIIRFHFSGAVFEMEPQATFIEDNQDHIICLTIRPSNERISVVIGAFQQMNHRILHDLSASKISWINEDCVAEA